MGFVRHCQLSRLLSRNYIPLDVSNCFFFLLLIQERPNFFFLCFFSWLFISLRIIFDNSAILFDGLNIWFLCEYSK